MTKLESALDLAQRGFFVFPIIAGKKAPPAVQNWQEFAMRDPAVIKSWWSNNANDNIGISTSKFEANEALLVVDVDVKGEKNGELELLRLELHGHDTPDTFTQITATGGRHLVYRVPSPVRQGTNVLGPGLDIRSRGGYIVGAGSTIGAGCYEHNGAAVEPAPAWLIGRCGGASTLLGGQSAVADVPAVDAGRSLKRVEHYLLHEAPLAIEGQGGDEAAYKVAAHCKDLGADEIDCIHAMYIHWNDRCTPPWQFQDLETKVRNAYKYGKFIPGSATPETAFAALEPAPIIPPEGIIEKPSTPHPYDAMNEEYAFVIAGGGAHILWETKDQTNRDKLEHLSISAFHLKFAPVKIQIGKKEEPLTNLWLEWKGRRAYDGLVFMPEQDTPRRFYNLWRGFAVRPAETAIHPAVEAFLEHTRLNVCRNDEKLFRWLLSYFAHLVQRPWDKPLVALVFRGGKGVGKNAVIERIGALLGGHFLLTSNRRYLIGNFNGHLENCLLFALDEAFWSGDKQAEGTLKDLITGRDHVIEHKGKEPYTVANKTRVVIIGNEDWLVPASHDERRFAVFDVGAGRKQDRGFFQSMREGMEAGGYACLLRYLLDYDGAGIDVSQAPHTQALIDQKHHTMDPLHQWWLDCLEESTLLGYELQGWVREVECVRFRSAFRRYCQERNIRSRIPEDRSIGRLLKLCAPGILKKRCSKKGDEGQPYAYQIPPLTEARTEWDTFIGHPAAWPKEGA